MVKTTEPHKQDAFIVTPFEIEQEKTEQIKKQREFSINCRRMKVSSYKEQAHYARSEMHNQVRRNGFLFSL